MCSASLNLNVSIRNNLYIVAFYFLLLAIFNAAGLLGTIIAMIGEGYDQAEINMFKWVGDHWYLVPFVGPIVLVIEPMYQAYRRRSYCFDR